MALVAAVILCTAWATPRTPGGPMKTIRQTWQRSVATLALFAAFGAEQGESQTNPAGGSATPAAQAGQTPGTDSTSVEQPGWTSQASLLQDAQLLIQMGKLDEAEAKVNEALKIAPGNKKATRYLKQIQDVWAQRTFSEAPAAGAPPVTDAAVTTPAD